MPFLRGVSFPAILSTAATLGLVACRTESPAPQSWPSATAAIASAAASAQAPDPNAPDALAWPTFPKDLAPLLSDDAVAPSSASLPSYQIDQNIDEVNNTVDGVLRLTFTNPTDHTLDELPLVLHPNASREMGVSEAESGALKILDVYRVAGANKTAAAFVMERPTLAAVDLTPHVEPGQRVSLEVRFEGELRPLPDSANDLFSQAMSSMGTMTAGAGAADYGLMANGDGIITMASAYPMIAPYREGSFDTSPPTALGDLAYNAIANYEVRTRTRRGVGVVTNLVDSPSTTMGPSHDAVLSRGTHVRDFVMVAARDLERTSTDVNGTRVTSVYLSRDKKGGQAALTAAASSLKSFESRFGDYPYRELDVVEASLVGGAGGVEFSSMVLVAGMLYRPPDESKHPLALLMKVTSGGGLGGLFGGGSPSAPPTGMATMEDTMRGALEFTVAHEVAHQYFAGLVGNDARKFPSLDEPIAQYAAGIAIEDLHGKAAGASAMDQNVKMNYAAYRMLGGVDKSVLRDTASFTTAVEYAALVYGKAPYLYVDLRKKLGDDKLHTAIEQAVDKHRFQIVSTEAWIDALEEGAGGPSSGVRPTFKRYLEGTTGDADLGVDGSGDFLFEAMLGPQAAAEIKRGFQDMGMEPGQLMRMLMGGGLGGANPLGGAGP